MWIRSWVAPAPLRSAVLFSIGVMLLAVCSGSPCEASGSRPVSDGANPDSEATSVALDTAPHVFKARDGREVNAELGRFQVRENRHTDSERTIELAFVRFPSTSPSPGAPIVYLAGGPGGSGTGTAEGNRFDLFQSLRQVADVIAFDQRGTGLSQRLPDCPHRWSYPLEKPATRDLIEAEVEAVAKLCAESWRSKGVDLDAYNTQESADDLEDLRRALGVPKISLWSISYGTHLAFSALRRHPESIDRVILAGAEGPDHTVKRPRDGQALLEALAARIAADPEAKKAFPDFLGSLRRVLARLKKEPGRVEVQGSDGEKVTMAVSAFDVQRLAANALRGPESMIFIPLAIKAIEAGDFSLVAGFLTQLRSGGFAAMPSAMDAASGISAERSRTVAAEAETTLLSDAINFPWRATVRGLGVRDLGDEFRGELVSKAPALFISGTLDGRTPVTNAEELLPGFEAASHLVIEGAGHSDPLFLSSPKIEAIMLDFLRGKPLPREIRLEVPVPQFLGVSGERAN